MNAIQTIDQQAPLLKSREAKVVLKSYNRLLMFERLINTLPINDFGLPVFLLRADMISPNFADLDANEQNQEMHAASIEVSYREGFPTFRNGIPLWGPMDHETPTDHQLFKTYLDRERLIGYRQLAEIVELPSILRLGVTREHLQELFVYNFWPVRAKAHDLFQAAAARKKREARILSATDHQYLKAEELLAKLEAFEGEVFNQDKLSNLSPKEYIEVMAHLTKIQNKALGIDNNTGKANKSNETQAPPNASMEVVFRQIAKDSGGGAQAEETVKAGALDLLLGDPGTAGIAQELIIRTTIGQTKPVQSPASEQALTRDAEADLAMLGRKT